MSNDTQTWPDLAIGLYDKLTGRGAQISTENGQKIGFSQIKAIM